MINKKAPFNSLKKLNIKKRMEVINNPQIGPKLLDLLTPTEFALLFPKAYRQGLPDVEGFRLAISRKSRQEDLKFLESLSQDVGSSSESVREFRRKYLEQAFEKVGGRPRIPQLSDAASKAFDAVQKGPIEVDSDMGRTFTNLTKEKLASVGIERYTQDGKSYYRYVQPEASREEAISRITSASSQTGSAAEAMRFFISKGWTKDQAAGIVGNLQTESINFSTSVLSGKVKGDGGLAVGLAQWHPKRQAKFQEIMGKPVIGSTFREQLEFVQWELNNSHSDAGKRLRETTDARTAADVVDQFYEVSSRAARVPRMNNASRLAQGDYTVTQDAKTFKPGPDGKYTEEQEKQIASIQEQLKTEKNASRRQKLASILEEAGVTATVDRGPPGSTATATNSWSSITPIGGTGYCGRGVANLAEQVFGREHFDHPGRLGTGMASDLSYGMKNSNKFVNSGFYKAGQSISKDALTQEFINNLPPGTIVSAGGGRSDGAGHIQMKLGNRWASDHWQKSFSFDRRDGRLYKDFVIYYPSDKGLKVMEEKGLITNVNITQVAEQPTPTASKVTYREEIEDDKSLATVDPNEQQVIAKAAEKAKAVEPVESTAAQPAAPAPETPKTTPAAVRYKFDEAAFVAEVREKEKGAFFVSDEYILNELRQGFKNTPGVTYKNGVLTVADPKSPAIKQVMEDMKSHNFDSTKFLKEVKEEKKPEPKPQPKTEVKPAPKPETKEPPKPEVKAETKPQPTPEPSKPAEQPKSDATVKAEPAEQKKVPGAATGGSFFAPDGIMPFNLAKGDDTLAVNPRTGESMFSFASNENISYNPNSNRVDIAPSNRPHDVPGPQMNMTPDYSSDIKDLGDRLDSMMKVLQDKGDKQQSKPQMQQIQYDNPNMIQNTLEANKTPYQTPSFLRAMARANGKSDYGDDIKGHFSQGNSY